METATAGALKEIREISANLMLPEIEKLKPEDVVWVAVKAHEKSTATKVKCEVRGLPDRLPLPVTICIFR
ncbi:hypothetical protein ACO1NF_13995, partial [Staphylococcus aureus]